MFRYLRAGAIAGALGGLALALFLLVAGESTIDDAIALEDAQRAHEHVGDRPSTRATDEVFTRGEQKLGGALGTVLAGVSFGCVFGIVFAAVRHRLPGRDDWQRALWLGGAAWLSVHLVPALKYPPNPPAVGNPDTVGERTMQYLLMIGVAIAALALAWRIAIALHALAAHVRLPVAGAAWFAVVIVAMVVFPPEPDEVNAPAQLVWHFREKALAGSAVSWAVTACVFGTLLIRAARPALEPALEA